MWINCIFIRAYTFIVNYWKWNEIWWNKYINFFIVWNCFPKISIRFLLFHSSTVHVFVYFWLLVMSQSPVSSAVAALQDYLINHYNKFEYKYFFVSTFLYLQLFVTSHIHFKYRNISNRKTSYENATYAAKKYSGTGGVL